MVPVRARRELGLALVLLMLSPRPLGVLVRVLAPVFYILQLRTSHWIHNLLLRNFLNAHELPNVARRGRTLRTCTLLILALCCTYLIFWAVAH